MVIQNHKSVVAAVVLEGYEGKICDVRYVFAQVWYMYGDRRGVFLQAHIQPLYENCAYCTLLYAILNYVWTIVHTALLFWPHLYASYRTRERHRRAATLSDGGELL